MTAPDVSGGTPLDPSYAVEPTLFDVPVDAPRKTSSHTGIEWTDRTWNPVTGCDRTSPGCDHCYALTMAKRLKAMGQAKYQNDGSSLTSGPGFAVTLHEGALTEPLRWRKPCRVFVNSMSDLVHPAVPDAFIADVFATMAVASMHTFQVLTKRPQRMAALLGQDPQCDYGWHIIREGAIHELDPSDPWSAYAWPPANVHLGTSIESDLYTFRANHLRNTPAAVRFLSLEPLLGPLPSLDLTGIDWCIVGGESGPGARPMHPDWARDIRDRCVAAGIPFHFKQRGAWTWSGGDSLDRYPDLYVCTDGRTGTDAEACADGGDWQGMWRVGKKAAGRELDGRTWDEMPS